MTFEEFNRSLNENDAPDGMSPYLTALWQEKHGDWNRAHEIVQDINDSTAASIHAYLHRREGDEGNAGYWYNRCNKSFPSMTLDEEWDQLVNSLLDGVQ